MSLFKNEAFTAHAGATLPFKIECDALADDDLETLASIISNKLEFSDVYGIPRGGNRLAEALRRYCKSDGPLLIVDDVLTTGMSMENARQEKGEDSIGVVIFSRSQCPTWVHVVFQLSEWARP